MQLFDRLIKTHDKVHVLILCPGTGTSQTFEFVSIYLFKIRIQHLIAMGQIQNDKVLFIFWKKIFVQAHTRGGRQFHLDVVIVQTNGIVARRGFFCFLAKAGSISVAYAGFVPVV